MVIDELARRIYPNWDQGHNDLEKLFDKIDDLMCINEDGFPEECAENGHEYTCTNSWKSVIERDEEEE
jgi:hypothetical protein